MIGYTGLKLAPSFQGNCGASWVEKLIQAGIKDIKLIDPPKDEPWPWLRKHVRFFFPDTLTNELVWQGQAGGRTFAEMIAPLVAERPWIYSVETANEPQPCKPEGTAPTGLWSLEFLKRLNGFGIGFYDFFKPRFPYINVSGNCFSVGWPHWGHSLHLKESFQSLDIWSPHEYSAKSVLVGDRVWVGRYQRILDELSSVGVTVRAVTIGEYGIDLGVYTPDNPSPVGGVGYRGVRDDPEWYANELLSGCYKYYNGDHRVMAVFPFVSNPYSQWFTFDVTESVFERLLPAIQANPPSAFEAYPIEPLPKPAQKITDISMELTVIPELANLRNTSIKGLVLHHFGAGSRKEGEAAVASIKAVARMHAKEGGNIAYTWVVDGAGNVYQTLPLDVKGNHCGVKKKNYSTAGIAMVGNNKTSEPPAVQVEAVAQLIASMALPWKPHRSYVATYCPGDPSDAWYKRLEARVSELNGMP